MGKEERLVQQDGAAVTAKTYTFKEKMAFIRENMGKRKALYIIGIIGTVVYNVMQLTSPYFSSKIVDNFFTGGNALDNIADNITYFYQLIGAMVGFTILRCIIVYFDCMCYERASQTVLYRVRTVLYDKVQRQDMSFYNTYRTGDLMTRMTGDLDAVRHMIAWVVRAVIESFTLFGATAIYFLVMDWRLALCLLAIAPFIFIVIRKFRDEVAPRHALLREKMAQMNTRAQENISGNRVVKAFAREDYECEKFEECNDDYRRTNTKTMLTWIKYFPIIESFANALPIVLLVVGGLFLISGEITMGQYVAFSGLIWALTNPMRLMGNIMNEFQRFSAAANKIMEIYYAEPQIKDAPDAVEHPERLSGKIVFDHVSFQYADGNLPVLKDVSFTAQPGQTIAIMGETGCGKTSLINLIPRFYEATEGTVLVDDIDVRKLKLKDLRGSIGIATQDVLLYSDTIDGNIAYGNSELKQEEIIKFARYSAAEDFISAMPDKYDTIVGERGVGLSGGQKQRISLARALAVRPSILILDDTTSAVDLETEKHIQESLENLDFECTKIIIAQRISSTRNADQILILQDGRITECGTHEELIAKKGYYYELVSLQAGCGIEV